MKRLFPQRYYTPYETGGNAKRCGGRRLVCRVLKLQKSLGIDGIPNVAHKAATNAKTEGFRKIFDECIQERIFPKI